MPEMTPGRGRYYHPPHEKGTRMSRAMPRALLVLGLSAGPVLAVAPAAPPAAAPAPAAEPSPVAVLAGQLAEAPGDAERSALLDKHRDLVGVPLREALITLGTERSGKGDFAGAIAACAAGLQVADRTGDTEGAIAALRGLGAARYRKGELEPALADFERGLALAERSGSAPAIARLLYAAGNVQQDLGRLDAAEESYRRALETIGPAGDTDVRLGVLNGKAALARKRGDYASALATYGEALALARAAGSRRDERGFLHNYGQLLALQGDTRGGLEYYQKSLAISEEMGDKFGMALTLGAIGAAQRSLGDHREAVVTLQRSLALAEEIGSKPRIAESLGNLALVYSRQWNLDLALDFMQRALVATEATGNPDQRATLLNNLGVIRYRRGEFDAALAAHREALGIKESLGQKAGIAITESMIAEALRGRGDVAGARQAFERSIAASEAIGDTVALPAGYGNLAHLEHEAGRHAEALELSERAVAVARRLEDSENLWEALSTSGAALRALGRNDEARRALEESIAVVESLRATSAGGVETGPQGFERSIAPYRELFALLADAGRLDEALAVAEKGKARVLLDTLRSRDTPILKGMTAEESERERRLSADLAASNLRLTRAAQADQPDPAALASSRAQVEQARRAREDNRVALYASHPDLRGRRGEEPPGSRADATALLRDGGDALLEYVVTKNATYLFVLTRAPEPDLRLHTIAAGHASLAADIAAFRDRLGRRDPGFRASAEALYRLLVEPVAATLRTRARWVVIPDGPLWELPMQALVAPGGRYLLEDHAISYAPSMAALRAMSRTVAGGGAAGRILVLANPAFGGAAPATKAGADARVASPRPLPDAEREAAELRRLYGNDASAVFTGAAAREERLKSDAGRYRVVHLATHGVLDDSDPMYSHLLLAPSSGGAAAEDGLLEAWEILDLDLSADLVVLSACETARGRQVAGEGTMGLAWSWFVAGAPATVVSQWKVESKSTSDLMVEFHRRLRGGASPAEALRGAALRLQRSAPSAHPYYWAGFVAIGDGYRAR